MPSHSILLRTAALAATFWAAVHAQPGPHAHAGTIVDALSSKPVAAEAIAYRTRNLGATGECPRHDDLLDRRAADADGRFEFSIPADAPQFVAVYCAPGYVPREQLENDNASDGSPVMPDAIRLFPGEERWQQEGMKLPDALQQALVVVLQEVSERLRQLFAADQQSFQIAYRELLPPDQRLVAIMIGRSPRAQPPTRVDPRRLESAARPAGAPIAQPLNAATMHLRYFASSTGAGFFPALRLFRREDQELIEILRNRAITRPRRR